MSWSAALIPLAVAAPASGLDTSPSAVRSRSAQPRRAARATRHCWRGQVACLDPRDVDRSQDIRAEVPDIEHNQGGGHQPSEMAAHDPSSVAERVVTDRFPRESRRAAPPTAAVRTASARQRLGAARLEARLTELPV
jgi:hypothetical protein